MIRWLMVALQTAIAMLIAGCPDMKRVCMRAEARTAAKVEISFCGESPELNSIRVTRDGKLVWDVGTRTRATPLDKIVYGVDPPGFESGGFAPLKAGDHIRISARGPGKNGSIEVVVE